MENEIRIFEIPIYYTSEENHNEKWICKKTEYIAHQIAIGATNTKAKESFIKCYKFESSWKYHKIIGFIEIKYDKRTGDLKYYVYKTTNKIIKYNQIIKLKFNKVYGSNLHDFIKNEKNEKISIMIRNKIEYIEKEIFKNKCYIDINSYHYISKYIDFKKLISDLDSIAL